MQNLITQLSKTSVSKTTLTLNPDVLLEIIYRSDIKTIKNLCKIDSATKALCDANKNRIYKRLLLRDFNISIDTIPLINLERFFIGFIPVLHITLEKIAEKLNIETKHRTDLALVTEITSMIRDYPSVLYNIIDTLFKASGGIVTFQLMELSRGITNVDHENFLFNIQEIYHFDKSIMKDVQVQGHIYQVNSNGDTPLTHYTKYSNHYKASLRERLRERLQQRLRPVIPNVVEPILELLLKAGSDVNFQDSNGDTALHSALYKENLHMTPLLLEYGANLLIKNKLGETPIDISLELGRSESILEEIKNQFPEISKEALERLPYAANPSGFLRLVKNTLQGKKIQINKQVYNRVKNDLTQDALELVYEISDITKEPTP
jgi:hypothetical protein